MRRRQPIGSLFVLQGIYPFVTPPVSEACITDIPDDLFTLEPDGKTDFKVE
jgi:hypothetical protein